MKAANAILATYARTRDLRDKVKAARDACLCERHEGVREVDGVYEMQSGTPCWKAARKWDQGDWGPDEEPRYRSFHFDPPIDEWCATCRQRQAYTEQYRALVREHAAAKRAVLRRGRMLVSSPEEGQEG